MLNYNYYIIGQLKMYLDCFFPLIKFIFMYKWQILISYASACCLSNMCLY